MRSRSDSPSSHSITKKLRPSGSVPKPNTSTMFGWPIWLTACASRTNRSTPSALADSSRLITLIAARLPITRVTGAVHRIHTALADLLLDHVLAGVAARGQVLVADVRRLHRERTGLRHRGAGDHRHPHPVVRTHGIAVGPLLPTLPADRHDTIITRLPGL
jgi:hypothetical protein